MSGFSSLKTAPEPNAWSANRVLSNDFRFGLNITTVEKTDNIDSHDVIHNITNNTSFIHKNITFSGNTVANISNGNFSGYVSEYFTF